MKKQNNESDNGEISHSGTKTIGSTGSRYDRLGEGEAAQRKFTMLVITPVSRSIVD